MLEHRFASPSMLAWRGEGISGGAARKAMRGEHIPTLARRGGSSEGRVARGAVWAC